MSYVKLGRKYHMDLRMAKQYTESPQKPEYTISEPKPTEMDSYKQIADEWVAEAPIRRCGFWRSCGGWTLMGAATPCQTKGKVERTVHVRDSFMVGIKYNSLADLNRQALAWAPGALLLAFRPIYLLQ